MLFRSPRPHPRRFAVPPARGRGRGRVPAGLWSRPQGRWSAPLPSFPEDWDRLKAYFASPSLQMASYTITEKGYSLRDMKGELLGVAKADMENGPARVHHAMAVTAALMLHRYQNGAAPMALVSMDNCSHNGEKLRASVLEIAEAWVKNGFADEGFLGGQNWSLLYTVN